MGKQTRHIEKGTRAADKASASKKRKKSVLRPSGSFILVFGVVAAIGIFTWVKGAQQQAYIEELTAKKAAVEAQIESENERKAQLEERKAYMQTKQYYEEVAKEKFGLVYEDEVLFKPQRD